MSRNARRGIGDRRTKSCIRPRILDFKQGVNRESEDPGYGYLSKEKAKAAKAKEAARPAKGACLFTFTMLF